MPHSIQQRGTGFPFAIYVLAESLIVGFARFSSRKAGSCLPRPHPYKTGQQLPTPSGSSATGFNSDIASSVKSPLLILSDHMLPLFPACLYESFLSLEEVILEYQPAVLNLSSLFRLCAMGFSIRFLKRPKSSPKIQPCRPVFCTTTSF